MIEIDFDCLLSIMTNLFFDKSLKSTMAIKSRSRQRCLINDKCIVLDRVLNYFLPCDW